jgi:hypothetical protein
MRRVLRLAGDEEDVAAGAAIVAVGPPRGRTSRRKLSAPFAAVAGRDVNLDFVYEHSVVVGRWSSVTGRSSGSQVGRPGHRSVVRAVSLTIDAGLSTDCRLRPSTETID